MLCGACLRWSTLGVSVDALQMLALIVFKKMFQRNEWVKDICGFSKDRINEVTLSRLSADLL